MSRIGLGILAAVLVGGGAYVAIKGVPIGEISELVSQGGEKVLREPMRPASGGRRVLVIALDGVGDDELRRAIAGGGAPHLAAVLGEPTGEDGVYEHAFAVRGALSILPSTTVAAWTSVFTGEPPARSGVPGNEWFVREERKFYAPAPVSVTESDQAVRVYTDDFVGAAIRVPTVYERADVRSYVSLSQVYRGADLLTTPDPGAFADLVTAFARGIGDEDDTVGQEVYAELDQSSIESLIDSFRNQGLPDLQVAYFPGVDLYTHVADNPIEDERAYLRDVIDPMIGDLLAEYSAQGALEDTYVVFVADHGHTPVLGDDRHALGVGGEDEPTAVIEAAGFRMRPYVIEPEENEQDYQATVAYQGAIAYVYLADRSTCPAAGDPCDWGRPPRLEEDVVALVRAFDAANRSGAAVPAMRGTLDLIFAREPRPTSEDALPFDVWDGERLVPIGAYLAANPRPDLLDLEKRLADLAAGPYGHRAGDVLLLTRSGAGRPIDDRYYFSDVYRSWHGSPSEQDSRIPLVVASPGTSGAELRDMVGGAIGESPSQLDVTRLILALLGRE